RHAAAAGHRLSSGRTREHAHLSSRGGPGGTRAGRCSRARQRARATVRFRASHRRVRQAKRRRPTAASAAARKSPRPRRSGVEVRELTSLRAELERRVSAATPRWNADPEDVQRSVAKLVLTLVEFLRELMERQAIRRMEAGTLTPTEVEAVGLAL